MAIGFNLSNKISTEAGAEVYIDNIKVDLNEIRLKTHDIMPSQNIVNANIANGAVNLNNEVHVVSNSLSHVKWNGSEWLTVSTLPFIPICLTVYNNEINILGSSQSSNYTSHIKWNGSEWLTVSTLPLETFAPSNAIVFNNELHIFYNNGYAYKLDGTSWTQLNNLPYQPSQTAFCVYNNKIHMLGGASNVNKHYSFNGTSWTQENDLSFECNNCSAITFNNKLHVLGGNSSGNWKNHYSLDGTSWTQENDLPFNLIGGSSSIYNNKLIVLGGTAVGAGSLIFYIDSYLVDKLI